MLEDKDFTEKGMKIEGQYENDRNTENAQLFKDVIRQVFDSDCLVGHHIVYEYREKRDDGFTYTMVQEIPSADALIFDHSIAKKLWGESTPDNMGYISILVMLAKLPVPQRDEEFGRQFYFRYGQKYNHSLAV